MTRTEYIAVMEEADDGFGVWFPDIPGCVSHGATPQEARTNAQEAALFHIEGMIEDGDVVPAPMPMEAAGKIAPDRLTYLFFVPVDVPEVAEPVYTRVNITLPDTLVTAIDRVAAGNRSGWLAAAANEKLRRDPTSSPRR